MDNDHQVKHMIDAAGILVALGSWVQLMPVLVNVLAFGWYLVRFGEWIYSKLKKSKNA